MTSLVPVSHSWLHVWTSTCTQPLPSAVPSSHPRLALWASTATLKKQPSSSWVASLRCFSYDDEKLDNKQVNREEHKFHLSSLGSAGRRQYHQILNKSYHYFWHLLQNIKVWLEAKATSWNVPKSTFFFSMNGTKASYFCILIVNGHSQDTTWHKCPAWKFIASVPWGLTFIEQIMLRKNEREDLSSSQEAGREDENRHHSGGDKQKWKYNEIHAVLWGWAWGRHTI